MLYEGTRDFLRAYIRMCFDPVETVKSEVEQKALPRYLPAFEKVCVAETYNTLTCRRIIALCFVLFEKFCLLS